MSEFLKDQDLPSYLQGQGLKVKSKMVLRDNVDQNFYVRTRLNEEYGLRLGCWIEANEPAQDCGSRDPLPPIVVVPEFKVDAKGRLEFVPNTDRFVIVCGRHRLYAYGLLSKYDTLPIRVLVVVEGINTVSELIAVAYKENSAGQLALTDADIRHTIDMLLDLKVPESKIPETLGQPVKYLRKYIEAVKSQRKRKKGLEVLDKVADGEYTVKEAAEEVGLPLEEAKQFIVNEKRRGRKEEADVIVKRVRACLTSTSNTLAANIDMLVERFEDGDVNAKFVLDLFKMVETRQKRWEKSIADRKSRFSAKVNGDGKK